MTSDERPVGGPRITDPQMLRLGGGQVLLRGALLRAVSHLAEAGAGRLFSVDGKSIPPDLRRLLDELATEAREYVRPDVRADVGEEGVSASSGVMKAHLTSAQAAETLGCSERHVRRIASSLGGRRVGAVWRFGAAEVATYQFARNVS